MSTETVVRTQPNVIRRLIPIAVASLVIARLLVPAEYRAMVSWARWLMAPLELAVIAYVAWQVRAVLRSRQAMAEGRDVMDGIAHALGPAFGRGVVARVLSTELGLLYYALLSWRRPSHVPDGAASFAHDRSSSLLVGITIVLVVETFVLHLLLTQWSATVAWVLTALSLYGLLWLLGDSRAIAMRPVLVMHHDLVLRLGVRHELRVPRSAVSRVERITWRTIPVRSADYLNAARPGDPNVVVHLDAPMEVQSMYGMRRVATRVGLRLVDPSAFVAAIGGD